LVFCTVPGTGLLEDIKRLLHEARLFDVGVVGRNVRSLEPQSVQEELAVSAKRYAPDLILLDLPSGFLSSNPSHRGDESLVANTVNACLSIPLVAMGADCDSEAICKLLRAGAADFIAHPIRLGDLVTRIWRFLKHAGSASHALGQPPGLEQFIGDSPNVRKEIAKIPTVARRDVSVLIMGETGTGKEICARAIHYLSPRAESPFVPVNSGAIPTDLIENELFGHEAGAFTSAGGSTAGLISGAEGGTLFLDEIDSLPLSAQVKLLRFLQEGEYRPLGSRKALRANVRIISASNSNLEEAMRLGRFRKDLYYRLNVVQLTMPALRERCGDVPLLARHFVSKHSKRFGQAPKEFSVTALQCLLLHSWPGNVRELENVIERALVMACGPRIECEDLLLSTEFGNEPAPSFRELKARAVAEFEKAYIQASLAATEGNITKAAASAQKNRRAFWELMRKYNISAHATPHSLVVGQASSSQPCAQDSN
jgi:DNA-binding NtrC family response regulator